MLATRLGHGPVIGPESSPELGPNIQGPSLVEVPDWAPGRLGRFHLYFADHKGTYIRLAFASVLGSDHLPDDLMADCVTPHIASPDVHINHASRRFIMYFHGLDSLAVQVTRTALSD